LLPLAGAENQTKVQLNYHGLDLNRFPSNAVERLNLDPVTLISVGRAVAKKGYDDLLAALALLPADVPWRLVHIGGGPLLEELRAMARELGLSDHITWLGAKPQAEVLAAYRNADIFVLASRIAEDGDRDGLPNVLMEAQSQGLAVISTNVSAIPELVDDGRTGLLVAPRDRPALAAAINKLVSQPDLRASMAAAGEVRVRQHFGHEKLLQPLAERFGLGPASATVPEAISSSETG
jgi:glycosyltransferase involved in cell wall biosynthesis